MPDLCGHIVHSRDEDAGSSPAAATKFGTLVYKWKNADEAVTDISADVVVNSGKYNLRLMSLSSWFDSGEFHQL